MSDEAIQQELLHKMSHEQQRLQVCVYGYVCVYVDEHVDEQVCVCV